eukprot:CAMPEP_0181318524 /NCGR_PEP_ID=MMETSP1101-20121128/17051_1 /TAXON_ID=46948 /ORGANISM="Rhodomonas abbreviata, Strain Caron Lab Isolate" /LENGTH=365 /DNA_ID=CAMNT_0023425997 /DNA_START=54 /DNA_END=1151 /DNA_ORIENTATION=-
MTGNASPSKKGLSKPVLCLWLAGVSLVAHSLFWHGCYHYTCSGGSAPENVAFRSRRSTGTHKYIGTFSSAHECESACIQAGTGKKGCQTFTYFTSADLKNQCFGNSVPGAKLVKDSRAIAGRPYFLSKSSIQAAEHPFAKKVSAKANELLSQVSAKADDLLQSISKWPIIIKAKGALPQTRPEVTDKLWYSLCVLLVVWPVLFMFSSSSSSGSDATPRASHTEDTSSPAQFPSEESVTSEDAVSEKSDANRIPIVDDIGVIADKVGVFFSESFKLNKPDADARAPEGEGENVVNKVGEFFSSSFKMKQPDPDASASESEGETPFFEQVGVAAFNSTAEGLQTLVRRVSLPKPEAEPEAEPEMVTN